MGEFLNLIDLLGGTRDVALYFALAWIIINLRGPVKITFCSLYK